MNNNNRSSIYKFLLSMWIMRKIDAEYLEALVVKGLLTTEEKESILSSQQI